MQWAGASRGMHAELSVRVDANTFDALKRCPVRQGTVPLPRHGDKTLVISPGLNRCWWLQPASILGIVETCLSNLDPPFSSVPCIWFLAIGQRGEQVSDEG